MQEKQKDSNNIENLDEYMERKLIEIMKRLKGLESLTDLERKILRELANKGPLCGYDFHLGGHSQRGSRKAICSSRSWLIVRKSLLDQKLIRPIILRSTKSSDNRGRRRDLYALTFRGLIATLYFGLIPPQNLVKAAEKNKIESLIFKKWNKILQYLPEKCALAMLDDAVTDIASRLVFSSKYRSPEDYKRLFKPDDQILESQFSETFVSLLATPEAYGEPLEKAISLLKSDPELRKLFVEVIVDELKNLKSALKWHEELLSKLNSASAAPS